MVENTPSRVPHENTRSDTDPSGHPQQALDAGVATESNLEQEAASETAPTTNGSNITQTDTGISGSKEVPWHERLLGPNPAAEPDGRQEGDGARLTEHSHTSSEHPVGESDQSALADNPPDSAAESDLAQEARSGTLTLTDSSPGVCEKLTGDNPQRTSPNDLTNTPHPRIALIQLLISRSSTSSSLHTDVRREDASEAAPSPAENAHYSMPLHKPLADSLADGTAAVSVSKGTLPLQDLPCADHFEDLETELYPADAFEPAGYNPQDNQTQAENASPIHDICRGRHINGDAYYSFILNDGDEIILSGVEVGSNTVLMKKLMTKGIFLNKLENQGIWKTLRDLPSDPSFLLVNRTGWHEGNYVDLSGRGYGYHSLRIILDLTR